MTTATPHCASRPCSAGDCLVWVLVADDCQDFADSLALLVKHWGYDVEVAYDGATAIATALRYRPDVIFLNLAMPKKDGCQVARQLRKEPCVKDALMVAVSGYADKAHRCQAREAGFDRYLVKPVSPVRIRALLRRTERL